MDLFSPEFLATLNAATRQFLEEQQADYLTNAHDPRWRAEHMQPGWAPVLVPNAKKGHAAKQNADGTWRILCRSPKTTVAPPPPNTTDDTWRVTCVSCRAKLGIRHTDDITIAMTDDAFFAAE